jgi:hypothetical protein
MMKTFALGESVDAPALDGLANVAADFYDMLANVRPELGKQGIEERRRIREEKLVDSAVMMHGYASVMREYLSSLPRLGSTEATRIWKEKLTRLGAARQYSIEGWTGEFFSKQNPLWLRVGVVKPSRDGRSLTTLNTGAARSECGRILRQFLALSTPLDDLSFLKSH